MSLTSDIWPLAEVSPSSRGDQGLFHEFLNTATMTAEIYELKAGATDPQKPHDLDELYFVISGTAQFYCDGESRPVKAGDTIFVAAHIEHRFHDITDDLSVLVVFSKKEPQS